MKKNLKNLNFKLIMSVFTIAAFLLMSVGSSDDKKLDIESLNNDITEIELTPEEKSNDITNTLNYYDKLLDSFNINSSYSSIEQIYMSRVLLYGISDNLIKAKLDSINPNNAIHAEQQRKKLIKIQEKIFPKFRQEYVKIIKQKLWVNDCYVKISGKNSDIISFTSGAFAANKNIDDFNKTITKTLLDLRFKEARYYWYEGSRYTYYDYKEHSQDDKDPVTSSSN